MGSKKPAKVSEVTDRRRTETTEAIRVKAEELIYLKRELMEKRCPYCGQTGCWEITCTRRRVRYIKCLGCQQNDKVVL